MKTIARSLPIISESFFLFGPRGSGKSTWLRQNYPNAIFIDLLAPDIFRQFSAHPEHLQELIEGNPGKKVVIVDEIQKIPEILPLIHKLIEEKKGIQFILTGSSSRKLRRSGVDLLAGRAILLSCHPFTACEMGELFSLENALEIGMLPLVNAASDPQSVLKSYAALYLKEEVQMEGLVRNIGSFSRFLETMSFSHSQVINVTQIARECEANRKTVEGYISVLRDLLIASTVPIFSRRAKRILVRHEKFYFFDAGVFRSLRPRGPLDRIEEIEGPALEGLVFQHLRARGDYSGKTEGLYYWHTKSGNEVDFIVYGETEFAAIEVKAKKKLYERDFKSLRAFKEDYPEAALYLLHRGNDTTLHNNVLCVPADVFLKRLVPGKPVWDGRIV